MRDLRIIVKQPPVSPTPNLADYDEGRATFRWSDARQELDGLPGGAGLNIAHEAVDRHAAGPMRQKTAFRFLRKSGQVDEVTYEDLRALSNRFANALRRLGVGPGDRVFALAGRIPALYVAALGTLKNRSVFSPLFSAFGPEPIAARVKLGGARVLLTTEALYRRKVRDLRESLPELEHVILVGDGAPATLDSGSWDYGRLLAEADDRFTIEPTSPEDPALLHFTSGTTGAPKGAVHVHEAVVAHHATGKLALDLHPDDVFWCTADPGWVTGTSYGIIAPLTIGVTSIVDEFEFDVERWYGILEDHAVNVWYTAPTAKVDELGGGSDLREELDMDSLDVLNFAAALSEQFGIPVPEADYPQLLTLDSCVAYVMAAEQGRHPRTGREA